MKNKHMNAIFLIFILALPFSWANMGSMSIYRLVTILIFAIWIFGKKFKLPIPNDERKKYFLSWIAYAGYTVFATILYPSSINILFGMILLIMISVIFFASKVDDKLERYIDYMWLSAAIFFILLYIFGSRGQVGVWGARETLVILGTPTDANEFSSFFVVALPIALFHVMNDKSLVKKVICAVVLLSGIYVVLMGGSRAALVSVFIALIITVFTMKKTSIKSIIVVLIVSIVLVFLIPKYILPMIPQETLARLSIESLRNDNGSGRSEIWKVALHMFTDGNPINWIMGYGYGKLKVPFSIGETSTMHNQYLQQLVSYGMLGLLLYIRMIILAYKQVKQKYRRYSGAYIGLMIMAMTLTLGPSYKILWILLFMAGIAKDENGGEKNDSYFNDCRYGR